MRIHEKWTLMSMPKRRATRTEPGMFPSIVVVPRERRGGRSRPLLPQPTKLGSVAAIASLVLVVDLAADLPTRLGARVHVRVCDAGPDGRYELIPLAWG